jgi:8-amino-7-oxononanoate synthase
VAAAGQALERYGLGAGAAHLVNGHTRAHAELEEELAGFTGRPRALLFSTGYMANLGVLQAVLGRHDTVLEDRLNHASLLDASRLAGCRVLRYRHADGRMPPRGWPAAGPGTPV